MGKEQISVKQGVCVIMLFIFGSSVVMGVNSEAEQDSWISLMVAAIGSIPMILVYARIVRLSPGMDLFEMLEALLGKVGGKVMVALMTWYALHLGALVLRNFSEFIQIAAMPETPQLPIMIVMMLVAAYMAKSGIETLGRWALGILPIILLVVVATVLLSLNKMDFFQHPAHYVALAGRDNIGGVHAFHLSVCGDGADTECGRRHQKNGQPL